MRVFAVATRCRHVEMSKSLARFAIEAAQSVMGIGARFFAIIAADTQGFVDQQHIGRLAEAVRDHEPRRFGVQVDDRSETFLLCRDEIVDLLSRGHRCLQPRHDIGLIGEQRVKGRAVDLDDFGLDRRAHRRRTDAAVDHRHFADERPHRDIEQEFRFTADSFIDRATARPDHEQVGPRFAFGDQRLTRLELARRQVGDNAGQIGRGEAGAEHLKQLALGHHAVDYRSGSGDLRHQLERRCALQFDEDAILDRSHHRAAPLARDQPDLAEELTRGDEDVARRIAGVDLDRHRPAR